MKKNGIATLLSVACIGLVCAVSAPAKADVKGDCKVTMMLYRTNLLQFTCEGNDETWSGYGPGVGCPASITVPVDTLKIWASMVQAAFLSGKRLTFEWNNNTCTHALYNLLLVP